MKHLALALLLSACAAKHGPTTSPTPAATPTAPAAGSQTDQGCICPMNYDPVCGTDGKTYSNECGATCAKVSVKAKGACP